MKNVWWAVTVALCLTATGAWAGGEEETEAAAAEPREMVEDATTGKMLLAPRYGGSISYAAVGSPPSSDTWFTHHSNNAINGVNESLAIGDWGIDRNVYAFDTDVVPVSVMIGQLAESWTMPDDVTVVFTIRDNVFWRDRPPTNGRQLTAHDIVYNWHRYLGLGQFAEQGISPSLARDTAASTSRSPPPTTAPWCSSCPSRGSTRCTTSSSSAAGRSTRPR